LDRSNWRSIPWAHIGLSIIGACQLLLSAFIVRNIVRFILSNGLARSSEAIGLLPTVARLSITVAILGLLIMSGVGLFLRSFLFGVLPALVFAGLLLLSQALALFTEQPVRWYFVAYAVVAILILLTCRRSALARDPL